MAKLDKLFTHCMHCDHRTAGPVYTCPVCDWPRAHTDETPPPGVGLPDNSYKMNEQPKPAPQLSLPVEIPARLLDDIPVAAPVPQAAAMNLAVLPDLGTVPPEFGAAATPIEPVAVPEVTLMPDLDMATLAQQAADRRAALQASIDEAAAKAALDNSNESADTILASLNYTPKPTTRKKKS
jgi:hypothetical protein